ncbi:MAG: primosomal protein N' [Elusimicrobia bacterium RIFCSPLOWO2_01_FULL_64_13]|nr:MAG: primosomal protein N' [Elusimicrobia bacterium RIFCSPHIGHO2_01_FULL_64_10]OGR96855.1 MAG: primosomal protein N' [Elusimicrobia bacterium RIFCSPLOWO2_01_FULL_64_13]
MTTVEVALPLPLRSLFTYSVPESLRGEVRAGLWAAVPFRNRTMKGLVVSIGNGSAVPSRASLKEIRFLFRPARPVPPHLIELARWISERTACSFGEAASLLSGSQRRTSRPSRGSPGPDPGGASSAGGWPPEEPGEIVLTEEQTGAASAVAAAVAEGGCATYLLHGVTSSGKTEVYLEAIERALAGPVKRQAIFLVPEISLCAPFQDILRGRFGERVGVWHSQVTPRERTLVSDRIHDGGVDIVIGARSALFAPLPNPGVIILDEEHDFSYKQEEKPRYHARDAAIRLAELCRATVILGSATPSVESYFRASRGDYRLLKLTRRVPSHTVPIVEIADRKTAYRSSRKRQDGFSALTPALKDAVTVALARREQVILALNRRGFSTYLLCAGCGRVWECPNCRITLIHHKEPGGEESLACHHCFLKMDLPSRCGGCAADALVLGGFGTQKVAAEAKKTFPSARVLRLDRDVARRKHAARETVSAFRKEDADILVGTQMVTQGLDFPRVSVVGIVDADTPLHHPDFRAAERTFQWIAQATGRAGRGSLKAKVIVQSLMPDHYALKAACAGSYEEFYAKELEFRRALAYPPFSTPVLFRIHSAKKKELVEPESDRLRAAVLEVPGLEEKQVLGPGPSSRENLHGELRWQILVKCLEPGQVPRVSQAGAAFAPKSGVKVIIDVDPYDVL